MEFKATRTNHPNKWVQIALCWKGEQPFIDKVLRLAFYDSKNTCFAEHAQAIKAHDNGRVICGVASTDYVKVATHIEYGPDEPLEVFVFEVPAAAVS